MKKPRAGSIKSGNWTVFHCGGTRHQLGVDFIVNDKVLFRVKKIKAINDKTYYIELECQMFNMVLINGYVPIEDKEEEVKNIFYESLDNMCDLISNSKVKIRLGDFNAKIGQKIIHRPTIGKRVYIESQTIMVQD